MYVSLCAWCVFVCVWCGGVGCRCLDSRRHLQTLLGHTDAVMCMASSGGKLFSGSWDATVRVWDARSLTCISILGNCSGPVVSIAPMRTSCIAVGVDFLHILPIHAPQLRHAADTNLDKHMDYIDAHVDTHMDTSCGSEGSASQERCPRKLDTVARSDAVVSVAVGAGPIACGKQGVSNPLPAHLAALSASTFLPDFRMLTGHKSGVIRAWNTSTWECELELQGHEDAVTTLAVWGSCLVSGAADGTVRLWDLGVPDSLENATVHCKCVVKIQSEVVSLQVHDPRAMPQTGAGSFGAECGFGRDGGAFILCGAKDRTVRVLAASVFGRQPSQLG